VLVVLGGRSELGDLIQFAGVGQTVSSRRSHCRVGRTRRASFLSYWLGADHGIPIATLSAAVVMLIGFIKAWLVGRYYMETRETTTTLRTIFDVWVTVSALATVGSILLL
jgi:hypothetical protein